MCQETSAPTGLHSFVDLLFMNWRRLQNKKGRGMELGEISGVYNSFFCWQYVSSFQPWCLAWPKMSGNGEKQLMINDITFNNLCFDLVSINKEGHSCSDEISGFPFLFSLEKPKLVH